MKNLRDWCFENGEYGKTLLSEWTGLDEKGNSISMDEIGKGSHIPVKWYCCKCDVTWVRDPHSRTGYYTKCPECEKKARSERVSKAALVPGYNDLRTWCDNHGEYGEVIKNEWTGVGEDGRQMTMQETPRGSGIKAIWKCSICGTVFSMSPGQRTGKQKSGCPECNTSSTSYPEQFIYCALKELFTDAISRGKYLGYEFDIIVPSKKLYIEYSPTMTHSDKLNIDAQKRAVCANTGVSFLAIIEDSKNNLDHYDTDTEICFYLDYGKKTAILKELVECILRHLGIYVKINYEKVDEQAFLRSHHHIPADESVAMIYPELCLEWNYNLNGVRRPEHYTPYSSEKLYWTCTKCGYGKNGEWKSVLSNRTHLKQGCPACGYTWFDKSYHNNAQPITIIGTTDFPSCYPELFAEWNEEKNQGIDPFSCRVSSHKRVFWKCTKCGYGKKDDWKTTIDTRIRSKTGCPACGYNCFDQTYHMTSGTNAVVEGKTDLMALYPRLAEEWDYTRNGQTLPNRIKPKSSQKFNWICQKCGYGENGEWITSPGTRVHSKTGCPFCGYNCFIQGYKTRTTEFSGEKDAVELVPNKKTQRQIKRNNQIVIKGINDLASGQYAGLLSEWNVALNEIDPDSITFSSHTSIYWTCTKCGYGKNGEWKSTINNRTNQKTGCPICGYSVFDGTYHKTTGRSTVLKTNYQKSSLNRRNSFR